MKRRLGIGAVALVVGTLSVFGAIDIVHRLESGRGVQLTILERKARLGTKEQFWSWWRKGAPGAANEAEANSIYQYWYEREKREQEKSNPARYPNG